MCCVLATLCAFSVARGQGELAPPSPARVLGAFNTAAGWLEAWSVPPDGETEAGLAAPAAAVELRYESRRRDIVGRGVAVARGAEGDVVDGAACPVAEAMRLALTEAEGRLPARNNAAARASLGALAPNMLISLEVAGAFVPVGKRTISDLNQIIQPGLEGVAVRIGERETAMFPAEMLRTSTAGGEAVAVLIRRMRPDVGPEIGAGGDEGAPTPSILIERGEAVVYKFSVAHVAQIEAGGAPRFLQRSGRVVEAGEIRTRELPRLAGGMAMFLMSRTWPGVEAYGLSGTLQPMTGVVDPPVAPAAEQALVAAALRRFARTPMIDENLGDRAEALAIDLLGEMARIESGESEPWESAGTAAMVVIAMTEGDLEPAERVAVAGLMNQCRQRVVASFDLEEGFAEGVPEGARGPVALALVRLAGVTRGRLKRAEIDEAVFEDARALAERAVRRVLVEAGAPGLPAQLPWIGFAEIELSAMAGDGEIPSAIALRDARELVWRNQLTPADAGAENADLIGGIVFVRARDPLPSWHSARAVAFPATMLGDSRLTDTDELGAEIMRLVSAIRFVKQLTVDEYAAAMHVNPRGTIGGVRSALWDARMPPSASAMSLIAVTEMIRSLDALIGDGRGAGGGAGVGDGDQ